VSPIQRSLAHLRSLGYEVARLERWNHYAKRREDVFGFDLLATNHEHVLFIQVCDDTHRAEHEAKLRQITGAQLIARHANAELWSWGLKLTRNKRLDGKLDRRKQWKFRRDSLGDS
jgi:hypothetical protein